jgi:hypothetical protein
MMKSQMEMKTQTGMSLVGVLITAAIAGFLTLAISQMIVDGFKGQKTLQHAVDFEILKSSLALLLNSQACNGAFRADASGNFVMLNYNTTPNIGDNILNTPVSIFEIRIGNSPLIGQNVALANGLTLNRLELSNAIYEGEMTLGTPPAPHHAFLSTLNVTLSKSDAAFGRQVFTQNFNVRLLTRAEPGGGRIERCELNLNVLSNIAAPPGPIVPPPTVPGNPPGGGNPNNPGANPPPPPPAECVWQQNNNPAGLPRQEAFNNGATGICRFGNNTGHLLQNGFNANLLLCASGLNAFTGGPNVTSQTFRYYSCSANN